MSAQRIAVTKNPGLPCTSAIWQPRTRFVDSLFDGRNLLRGKSLRSLRELLCPTDASPFGSFPGQVLQFGTFSLFWGGNPDFVLTFPQIPGFLLWYLRTTIFPATHYSFTGTFSL